MRVHAVLQSCRLSAARRPDGSFCTFTLWDNHSYLGDENEALCFAQSHKFGGGDPSKVPQGSAFWHEAPLRCWQEVNLWSSRINCPSQGRLASVCSPSCSRSRVLCDVIPAEEGRLLLCGITKDGLVGFSPSFSAFCQFPCRRKAASPRCINAHQRAQSGRLAAGYSRTGEAKVERYRRRGRMWPRLSVRSQKVSDWSDSWKTAILTLDPGSARQYFFVWGKIRDIWHNKAGLPKKISHGLESIGPQFRRIRQWQIFKKLPAVCWHLPASWQNFLDRSFCPGSNANIQFEI